MSAPHTKGHFANPRHLVEKFGIEHGTCVVDFGAGSGAYVLAIAEYLGGSGKVLAVDIQRELLRWIKNEAVRRGYKNVEIIWGDVEVPGSSKIADHAADVVLISNLLFQVEEKGRVLEEARRVLNKRGGKLIIIDWSESEKASPGRWGVGPHRRAVVSKKAAQELAERAGFILEREFQAGAHHYGLIFRVQ